MLEDDNISAVDLLLRHLYAKIDNVSVLLDARNDAPLKGVINLIVVAERYGVDQAGNTKSLPRKWFGDISCVRETATKPKARS